jgi:hypothetical protein
MAAQAAREAAARVAVVSTARTTLQQAGPALVAVAVALLHLAVPQKRVAQAL